MTTLTSSDRAEISSILASGENLWRGYEIVSKYSTLSNDQAFWFSRAVNINKMSNDIAVPFDQNIVGRFIIDASTFGLAMDGLPADMESTLMKMKENLDTELV